jgi:hypothetical protein
VIRFILGLVGALVSLLGSHACDAHSVGTSYMYLSASADTPDLGVRVDFNLRDVELALGVDTNHDGAITWGELQAANSTLSEYVSARLALDRAGVACRVSFDDLLVNELGDGIYAVLQGRAACASQGRVALISDVMFDMDAQHRTLLNYKSGSNSVGTVLSVDRRTWQAVASDAQGSRLREIGRFIAEGVHHIWIGFDHLAFLIILLLPAVVPLGRSVGGEIRRPVMRVLAIVSAFTVAHSITLGLAVLHLVTLPERAVEVAIAGSVIVAALANLHPRTRDLGPVTAFSFGLLHGFGFANALAGLELGQWDTGLALLGFNVGVELGQLAVVAGVLPVLHLARHTRFYVMKVVPTGSLAVAGMGTVWLMQRLAI